MSSFTQRLTLWYASVATLTVVAVLVIGRIYLEKSLLDGIDLLNRVEFQEIKARLDAAGASGDDDRIIQAIREHAELDAALYLFQIGRGPNQVIFRSANMGPHSLPYSVHGHARITVNDPHLGPLRSSEFHYAGFDIHIASSLESAFVLFDQYARASVTIVILTLLLSLAIGYGMCRLAMRPIAAIQRTAARVTSSNLSERIPVPNTQDEVARMAHLLNTMLERLEQAYEQMKRFTAEASHELRTPLSIIRLQAERLLSHPHLPEQEREAGLREQMEEIEHLNRIIEDLLLVARADAAVLKVNPQSVDLDTFIGEFRTDADLLAEQAGVHFAVSDLPGGSWSFDPAAIRRLLFNLLENAIRVTPPGGRVSLEVEKSCRTLLMRMQDEGPGIPEELRDRIFNRFERLENTGFESAGNGLGLAICRHIAHLHGGSITAGNRSDRSGLVMAFRLPAGKADAAGLGDGGS
jgi:signal transduction histidine kinase